MKVYLIRHEVSAANTGDVIPNYDMPCNQIPCVPEARQHGFDLGKKMADVLHNCHIYHSPYLRAQQTTFDVFKGAGFSVEEMEDIHRYSIEEPRLREINVGTDKFHRKLKERKDYGWFYYQFSNGESPAMVYDRICGFWTEALGVALGENKDIVIISHGLTIRTIVMRALRLTVEQFNMMDNPKNCQVITISECHNLKKPVFANKGLGVEGITLRRGNDYHRLVEI